jgi:hypothetical protein
VSKRPSKQANNLTSEQTSKLASKQANKLENEKASKRANKGALMVDEYKHGTVVTIENRSNL